MAIFRSDDVQLAYDDSGASAVPVIVFLHGLSQARSTWTPFVSDLEGRFRVVRLDQRGHGESSHAPGTYVLDTYVTDTVAFLESVVGAPCVLVGHSLGGVIAHRVAQTRPELATSALLEDPPLYVTERMGAESSPIASMFPIMQNVCREMQGRNAPLEEYEAMFAAVPALNGKGTFAEVLGPDGTRAMAEMFSRLDPDIFTPAIDGSAIASSDATPVSCPVTVLRADPALGAAFSAQDEMRFLAVNPNARVVEFAGASHAIHDEEPARFLDELLALVDRVPA